MSETFRMAKGSTGPDRRDFLRIDVDFPATAKFLSVDPNFSCEEVVEGRVTELSASGLLIVGSFPEGDWVERLLKQKLFLGLQLELDDGEPPIDVLARAMHAEPSEDKKHAVGLRFRGMGRQNRDRIFKLVIDEYLE